MLIKELAWRERGRALYAVPESTPPPIVLSMADARNAVVRRLRASLDGLSEQEQDAAVEAAAGGYLQTHRARGHCIGTVTAVDTRASPVPNVRLARPIPDLPAQLLAPAPPRTASSPPHGEPKRPVAVTFTITQDHPLTRGLGGGRVRIPRGESAVGAVVRRIGRDTRCEIVGVVEQADADGAGRQLRVTLRGSDGRGHACQIIEGVIRVRI